MTAMLASVTSPSEAAMALAAQVDIIDLKDPVAGALGALPGPRIARVAARVAGRCPVSAAAGAHGPDPAPVIAAVGQAWQDGVDFVKLGLLDPHRWYDGLTALHPLISRGVALVAVLFADHGPPLALLPCLARTGFAGVMLDTAGKDGAGLRDHMGERELHEFTTLARDLGLQSGLAGSLTAADIAPLLRIDPDYLGFRGALCVQGHRRGALDPTALRKVRARVPRSPPLRTSPPSPGRQTPHPAGRHGTQPPG